MVKWGVNETQEKGVRRVWEYLKDIGDKVNYPPPKGGWACNCPVVLTAYTSDLFSNRLASTSDVTL